MLTADVEAWLRDTNPAMSGVLRRITEIILGADPRLAAYLKHGTVQFAYGGDLAAFVQPKGKIASLMFYRGAAIPGDYPHLEGDGPTARFMRFADVAAVDERAHELAAIARAWCKMQSD